MKKEKRDPLYLRFSSHRATPIVFSVLTGLSALGLGYMVYRDVMTLLTARMALTLWMILLPILLLVFLLLSLLQLFSSLAVRNFRAAFGELDR